MNLNLITVVVLATMTGSLVLPMALGGETHCRANVLHFTNDSIRVSPWHNVSFREILMEEGNWSFGILPPRYEEINETGCWGLCKRFEIIMWWRVSLPNLFNADFWRGPQILDPWWGGSYNEPRQIIPLSHLTTNSGRLRTNIEKMAKKTELETKQYRSGYAKGRYYNIRTIQYQATQIKDLNKIIMTQNKIDFEALEQARQEGREEILSKQ